MIKISRGFVILPVFAFILGLIFLLTEHRAERQKSSVGYLVIKFLSIMTLLVTVAIMIPGGIWHSILLGSTEGFRYAQGTNPSTSVMVFYAGALAFIDGMFPLKVPAIASHHRRSDMPIELATVLALLTRWVYCVFASTILMNSDLIVPGSRNVALAGIFFYIALIAFPEIVDE